MENLTPSLQPSPKQAPAVPRDAKGRVLPGHSLNPSGKPVNALKREIQAFLLGQSGDGRTRLAEQFEAMQMRAAAGDANATRLLWEYGFGKPAIADEDREAIGANGRGAEALAKIYGLSA